MALPKSSVDGREALRENALRRARVQEYNHFVRRLKVITRDCVKLQRLARQVNLHELVVTRFGESLAQLRHLTPLALPPASAGFEAEAAAHAQSTRDFAAAALHHELNNSTSPVLGQVELAKLRGGISYEACRKILDLVQRINVQAMLFKSRSTELHIAAKPNGQLYAVRHFAEHGSLGSFASNKQS
ncbi:MAG: hypothetical protein AABW54_03665 [Candidatus Micrarchaeota archaeon]